LTSSDRNKNAQFFRHGVFLNWLIVDEFTTASGKLVHIFTILSVKYYFLMSYLTLFLVVHACDQ